MDNMDERIINITLRKTRAVPRTQRARRAISELRSNVARHMKVSEDDVWIDKGLNEAIWARGITNPPIHVTVKAVKFEDDLVEVSLPEVKEDKPVASN